LVESPRSIKYPVIILPDVVGGLTYLGPEPVEEEEGGGRRRRRRRRREDEGRSEEGRRRRGY